MITIMGATAVLMKGLMVLVEANKMMLCHEIQIIISHKVPDHGGRPKISQQRRHLDRLVNLSYTDDYSNEHNKYSQSYHSLEGQMKDLDLTSR